MIIKNLIDKRKLEHLISSKLTNPNTPPLSEMRTLLEWYGYKVTDPINVDNDYKSWKQLFDHKKYNTNESEL